MPKLNFKRLIGYCLVMIALIMPKIASGAVALEFSPTETTVGIGDEFTVDVLVSGLSEQSLASYDIIVGYDNLDLEYKTTEFGNQLKPSISESEPGFIPSTLGVRENTDDPSSINGQPDSFFLFNLSFEAISIGSTEINVVFPLLFDSAGIEITPIDIQNSTINIVPIPGAAWLLASALLGVVGLKKRAHHQGL